MQKPFSRSFDSQTDVLLFNLQVETLMPSSGRVKISLVFSKLYFSDICTNSRNRLKHKAYSVERGSGL